MASSIGLIVCGCATLERGSSDEVSVVSNPPGATVTTSAGITSAGPNCRSPCRVYVDRRDDFTVTISKPGFGTQAVEVKSRLASADAKDAASLPSEIRGAVLIDNIVGALYNHAPNPVVVKLAPAS